MNLEQSLVDAKKSLHNQLKDITSLTSLVQEYTDFVRQDMAERSYFSYSESMYQWFSELPKKYNEESVNSIHQLALVELMLGSLSILDNLAQNKKLPQRVIDSAHTWFEFLIDEIISERYQADIESDLFKKDLSITALNMWPSDSLCHYELNALPLRFLVKNGVKQFVSASDLILRKLKGNRKNLYESHMEDRRMNPHFLESGWRQFYTEIAERIETEPSVSGLFTQSWFWDPRVGEISSNMAYLRTLPEEGGASFYFLNESNESDHVALKHKKRKRFYDEGKYIPKSYLMIWSRDDLIAWAKTQ